MGQVLQDSVSSVFFRFLQATSPSGSSAKRISPATGVPSPQRRVYRGIAE